MKTAQLLAVAAAAFLTTPVIAQQAGASTQQSAADGSHINESGSASGAAHASPGSAQVNETSGGAAAGNLGAAKISSNDQASAKGEMRPVSGELQHKLDSKTAKPGDPVVLKTNEKMKTADGTVIPKGSRLVGHVTEVQRHDAEHADSRMGMAFDRAELKNGQSVAIHSTIESVGPRASAMTSDAEEGDDSFGAPMGGGRAVAGGRAGGGLVGGGGGLVGGANGAVGGAVAQTGYATERAGAGLASTAGGAVRATGHVAGETTAGVGADAHAVAGGSGALAAHATGIPGLMLAGGAAGSSSGMFSASKKDIRLESGTQMQLNIVAEGKQ